MSQKQYGTAGRGPSVDRSQNPRSECDYFGRPRWLDEDGDWGVEIQAEKSSIKPQPGDSVYVTTREKGDFVATIDGVVKMIIRKRDVIYICRTTINYWRRDVYVQKHP